MPTTFSGLLLFIASLAPGFVYVLIREQRRPAPPRSALRESAMFVLASLLCNSVTMAVFGVVRTLKPAITPDVGRVIREPTEYARAEYALLISWSWCLLFLSCLLALLLAHQDYRNWKGLGFLQGPIILDTAWEVVFNAAEVHGLRKYCGCLLEDGTWVGGFLASSSPDPTESGDRELVLAPPIRWRASSDEAVEDSGAERAVISARRVLMLDIRYYDAGVENPFLTSGQRSEAIPSTTPEAKR